MLAVLPQNSSMQIQEISLEEWERWVQERDPSPQALAPFDEKPFSREEFLQEHQFAIYPTLERYNDFFSLCPSLQLCPNEAFKLQNVDLLSDAASSDHIIRFKDLRISPERFKKERIQDRFRFWPKEKVSAADQDIFIRHLQMGYMLHVARSLKGRGKKKEEPLHVKVRKAQYEKAKENREYASAKPVTDKELDALLGL